MVHSCYEITALNFYLSNASRCVRDPHIIITVLPWVTLWNSKYTYSTYYKILEFISFIYARKYGGINSNMHGTDVLRISLNIPGIVLNVIWETNWINFFRNRWLRVCWIRFVLICLGTVLILSAANKTMTMIYWEIKIQIRISKAK